MQNRKVILIAGGTGLVGKQLQSMVSHEKYDLVILSRKPKPNQDGIRYVTWDTKQHLIDKTFTNADIIINLAGEGIADQRWTDARKKLLEDSRINSALTIEKWIKANNVNPEVYISASAVGYYGHRKSEILTESSTPGNEFLSESCIKWEEAAGRILPLVKRMAILRIGIVLSTKGGALPKMLMTAPFGFLSYFGDGSQYYPWIHIEDLCRIILKCVEDSTFEGIINAVAPQEITNKEMMSAIKNSMKSIFTNLPAPAFILKLMLGEMSKVVLNSNRVVPQRLQKLGFDFHFNEVGSAVLNLKERKM